MQFFKLSITLIWPFSIYYYFQFFQWDHFTDNKVKNFLFATVAGGN